MAFDVNGKVAIVTGAASGIGLHCAKELLNNGIKGLTIVDIDSVNAERVLNEIEIQFGPNRAQFVKTDVSDIQQYENAFKKTVEVFKHVDILINNAGIFDEKMWDREVAINFNGVINGILLGLEHYLSKYKQGSEALIVNISSITAFDVYPSAPIYSGIKAGILAMTRCWADPIHYQRTQVKIVAICPGITETSILTLTEPRPVFIGEAYSDWVEKYFAKLPSQKPDHLAKEIIRTILSCPNGSIWVIEENKPAFQYKFPETFYAEINFLV